MNQGVRQEAFWQRMLADGPPLLIVAFVFVGMETLSLGHGSPALGLGVLAFGLLATVIADRMLGRGPAADDAGAASALGGQRHPRSLPAPPPRFCP